MRLFTDTNIFLEIILEQENAENANHRLFVMLKNNLYERRRKWQIK